MLLPEVEADDLLMYAINEGELYARHCEMARNHEPGAVWFNHVIHWVIPGFVRETHQRVDGYCHPLVVKVADELKAYYERAIKEG